jgi:hypothetical protein
MNRRGIALETAVALILIAVSLAIAIIIIFSSGLVTNLQTAICTTLTTGSSFIRGFVIHWIWIFYGILIGLVAAIIFLLGATCKAFPIGTAFCAAIFAIFVAVLTVAFTGLTSAIPLISCPNPTIIKGVGSCYDTGQGVSAEIFSREIADRTVDCWAMYTQNAFDPLSGRDPPNPITCFVLNFKLQGPDGISMRNISEWMVANNFSRDGTTYAERLGHQPIPQNKDESLWNKLFKKGRIFIKYGDDQIFPHWGSADCDIDASFKPPNRVEYFNEYGNLIEENAKACHQACYSAAVGSGSCSLGVTQTCADDCSKVSSQCFENYQGCRVTSSCTSTISSCSLSQACTDACAYVPLGCAAECVYRNQGQYAGTCSAQCLAQMPQCSSTCMTSVLGCSPSSFQNLNTCVNDCVSPECAAETYQCAFGCSQSILSCTGTVLQDVGNCLGTCILPPNKLPLLQAAWTVLTTRNDYVYWCIEKDVACDENCQTEVTKADDHLFCVAGDSCSGCELINEVSVNAGSVFGDWLTNNLGLGGWGQVTVSRYYQCPTAGGYNCGPACAKLLFTTADTEKVPCVTG